MDSQCWGIPGVSHRFPFMVLKEESPNLFSLSHEGRTVGSLEPPQTQEEYGVWKMSQLMGFHCWSLHISVKTVAFRISLPFCLSVSFFLFPLISYRCVVVSPLSLADLSCVSSEAQVWGSSSNLNENTNPHFPSWASHLFPPFSRLPPFYPSVYSSIRDLVPSTGMSHGCWVLAILQWTRSFSKLGEPMNCPLTHDFSLHMTSQWL